MRAILVTTVASEAMFSIKSRILDPFRSFLSPKMVEMLLRLKNWLSRSYHLIIVKDYMDDNKVFEISLNLVKANFQIFHLSCVCKKKFNYIVH